MNAANPKNGVALICKTAAEIMQEALPKAIKQLRQQIDDDMYASAKKANNLRGKRVGIGRPPATDKATLLITIKATPAQKAKFLKLGGSRWVKRLLEVYQPKEQKHETD